MFDSSYRMPDDDFDPPDSQGCMVVPDPEYPAKKAKFDEWCNNWLAVTFVMTKNGLTVFSVGKINPLEMPTVRTHDKFTQVCAKFLVKPRAGQFCKRPHELIDFKNTYSEWARQRHLNKFNMKPN